MRYITIYPCLLAFCVALAAMWPQPLSKPRSLRSQPHWTQPHYSIKNYCAEHPDVCRRGRRMVRYTTPTPIPQKGYVVVLP